MANRSKAKVIDIIQRVFPDGTQEPTSQENSAKVRVRPSWDEPPYWPPDMFALAAFLLERSGLYTYLNPGTQDYWREPWFLIKPSDHTEWMTAANEWKRMAAHPELVRSLWSNLIACARKATFSVSLSLGEPIPTWVKDALGLMIIADEACSGIGYLDPAKENFAADASWIALLQLKAEAAFVARATANRDGTPAAGSHRTVKQHLFSMTRRASQDLLAVQPKAHTSQVGATLRTISHNLALLPPPSRMGATWSRITGRSIESEELNILLVPLPYEFDDNWVRNMPADGYKTNWGWFEIRQDWLPEDPAILCGLVSELILKSEKDSGKKVHALMFPEYSLSWKHYDTLIEYLVARHENLEFVVAGSSDNCEKYAGNFVFTSSITRENGAPIVHTNSRGKHHRWRLDKSQVTTYDLERCLTPKIDFWWEGIALLRRVVHTHVFRNDSCFTTFICEDLARSDPSHETVRALGPSLVFCLLMDGPQVHGRWSTRYAEGLVEDPGSAIITFTSRGLIERMRNRELSAAGSATPADRSQGKGYPKTENWSIAFWRDKENRKELHCPPGDHALLLELRSQRLKESSYDGRRTEEGITWQYEASQTVRLDEADAALIAWNAAKRAPEQQRQTDHQQMDAR